MPASAGIAQPIQVLQVRIASDAQAAMKRLPEEAGETGLIGVPCQVDVGTGFIIECATIHDAATALIAGFTAEFFSDLTTSGVPKTLTYGSVQNQASAVLIPVGAPPNDGTIGFNLAIDSNIFVGVLGNSSDGTLATIAQTDEGAIYGLTKDATNHYWYIDNHITATVSGACVQITDLVDPVGTLNGKLGFKVLHAAQQLSGN